MPLIMCLHNVSSLVGLYARHIWPVHTLVAHPLPHLSALTCDQWSVVSGHLVTSTYISISCVIPDKHTLEAVFETR